MAAKVKSKLKLSEIVFYVCAGLMTFSIFMLFMENLKWINEWYVKNDVAIPSFFDLIFGNYGSHFVGNWPVVGGMVILFIFQIAITTTCLVIAILMVLKKISRHTAVCILTGVAVLAVTCAVLSFCSKLMIDRKSLVNPSWIIETPLNGLMKLNYGAYVYGITMIVAACGSVGAFVLDHYNK